MSEPTIDDPTILRWFLVRIVLERPLTPSQFIPVEAAVNGLTSTKTCVVNTWGNPLDFIDERLVMCGFVQATMLASGAVDAAEEVLAAVGSALRHPVSAFTATSDFALAMDAVEIESPDLEPKVKW